MRWAFVEEKTDRGLSAGDTDYSKGLTRDFTDLKNDKGGWGKCKDEMRLKVPEAIRLQV